MNTKEAIHAILVGKKVYRKSWKNDYVDYFYFDGECFRDEQDVLLMCDFHGDDWEIYEEPKPKQTVTIEKWLVTNGIRFDIAETSDINACLREGIIWTKVKLLGTQEVDI